MDWAQDIFVVSPKHNLTIITKLHGNRPKERPTNKWKACETKKSTDWRRDAAGERQTHKKNFSVLSQWYIEYVYKAQGIYIACYSSLHSVCIVIQLKWCYCNTLICFTICCITAYNSSCNNQNVWVLAIIYQRPKLSDRKTHAFRSFSAFQI